MVLAGQGQDKNVTNTILEWKELGINLGRMDPSVDEIREGVSKVLDDTKYRENSVAMSRNFKRYDLGTVFDGVIQDEIREWRRRRWAQRNWSTNSAGKF
jgi:UDP:flavonoid glycosyltransferase YjiC (YdhE family)